MATEVIMPKLGVDMKEGQILNWRKKEGDEVKEGEILLEIQSDKTNMELEAEASGVLLKIYYEADAIVPVTTTIAYIGAKGEALPEAAPAPVSAPTPSSIPAPTPSPTPAPVSAPTPSPTPAPVSSSLAADEYEIIVVGAGPAGYIAAIKAAQLGAKKVAIIERSSYGGTCLNRGCIPTKTFLKNAEIIESVMGAKSRGIMIDSARPATDLGGLVKYKDKVVSGLSGGVKGLLKSYNVDCFDGTAIVSKDKTVKIGDKTIRGHKIILATGSVCPSDSTPGGDSKLIFNSDTILDYTGPVPKSMAVIGSGIVGLELGLAYAAFGAEVSFVAKYDVILPSMDREVSELMTKMLKAKNIKIYPKTKVTEIIEENSGTSLRIKLEGHEDILCERALFAAGRTVDMTGIDTLGLELGNRGAVKVDDYMQTSLPDFYAPGDMNRRQMLAHSAFRMAEVAVENALFGNKIKVKLTSTPTVAYTLPEIAAVGLTEAQAREKHDVLIGKFPFAANGRALASGHGEGFVKVIIDAKYHEVLGVHIIGPDASEIINIAAALVEMEMTADEMATAIIGHPTYSEALYEAILDALGKALHLPKRK